MESVNLARRPFVNRRPVLRLAVLLWIVGAALTVYNLTRYLGHWQGKDEISGKLDVVNADVQRERTRLGELDQQLARVSLEHENVHAEFLNRLIAYRTFPWSTLFDDLEEVIPLNVRLHNVSPAVNLKAEPEGSKRRRSRSRRTSSARSSAAQPATATGDGAAAEAADAPDEAEERPLKHGEVRLTLSGVAKNEDAVVDLIEALYASAYFHSPFLPGESFNPDGSVNIRIGTVYLTRSPGGTAGDQPDEADGLVESTVAEAAGGQMSPGAREGAGIPGATGSTSRGMPGSSSVAGTVPPGLDQPSTGVPPVPGATVREPSGGSLARDPRDRRPAVPRSRLGAGATAAGVPVAGAPAADAPAADAPAAGAPAAGVPVAEAPTADAPAAGGTPSGAPAAGAPVAGAPVAGTSSSGTSSSGASALPGSEAPPPSGGRRPATTRPGAAPPSPSSDRPGFADPPASGTPPVGSAWLTPAQDGHPAAPAAGWPGALWEARA